MFKHRLTRTAAVALAIAATAAPAASADDHWRTATGQPQGVLSPDASDAAAHRGVYEPRPQAQPQPRQDLRNPDTIDFAAGRGTYNSPEVVVVESPTPASQPVASGGIDWQDVGIGAGGLLAMTLIGLGGALFVVHRRGVRTAH